MSITKKTLLAGTLLIFVVVAGISCKKIIKSIFPGIEAAVPEIKFGLPAVPFILTDEAQLATFMQSFNLDSTIKANTAGVFGASDVTSLKVKSISFKIINPDVANNLSNFVSTRFTLSSDVKTTPVEIAAVTFPDVYADSVNYIATNAPELKEYVQGSTLNYNVYGKSRRITTKKLNFSVKVILAIK